MNGLPSSPKSGELAVVHVPRPCEVFVGHIDDFLYAILWSWMRLSLRWNVVVYKVRIQKVVGRLELRVIRR